MFLSRQILQIYESMTQRGIEELKRAGLYDKNSDYEGATGKAVEALLKVFGKQGHSGFSASLVSTLFKKLCDGHVLSPLTTDPSEWMDINNYYGPGAGSNELFYQNKRCSNIFTTKDGLEKGRAYTLDGIVWKDKEGCTFTNNKSKVWFDLPGYPPETQYKKAEESLSYQFLKSIEGFNV